MRSRGFDIALQLFVELTFGAAFREERLEASKEIGEPSHRLPPYGGGCCKSGFEDAGDGGDLAMPLLRFGLQSFASFRSQQIVPGTAVVLCGSPLGFDVSGTFHAAERREQGTGIHAENAAADLLDAQGYSIAVHRLKSQGLEDEHLKGALHKLAGFRTAAKCGIGVWRHDGHHSSRASR